MTIQRFYMDITKMHTKEELTSLHDSSPHTMLRNALDNRSEDIRLGNIRIRVGKDAFKVIDKLPYPYHSGQRDISQSTQSLWQELPGIHYYNISENFAGLVDYDTVLGLVHVFVTLDDWIDAKVTKMKLGKYLRKLGMYTDAEVNKMTNLIKSLVELSNNAELSLATGEDIVDVYLRGPHSCMAGSSFSGAEHPVSVYNTPDIACAYVVIKGSIKARSLINLVDNTHSVIYGNDALLLPLLNRAGYEKGSLYGCRILKIEESSDIYIMPYVDGVSSCSSLDHTYFVLDDGKEEYCSSVDGVTKQAQCCCHCDTTMDEDAYYNDANGEDYCSISCVEADGYVQAYDRNGWTDWNPEEDSYYCETDEHWYKYRDELVEVDGLLYKDTDAGIVYSEDQEEYLLIGNATDIDGIGFIDSSRIY